MPDDSLLRTLLWTILLLPFLSGMSCLLAGRRLNASVGLFSAGLTLLGLVLTGYLATLADGHVLTLRTDWISLPHTTLPLVFRVDALTLLMLGVVHFIALLVQLYSVSYLQDERDRYRYFGFLALFVGSMLGIVLAGSLILLYVFWELVGLSSYLLIGFWYQRPAASQAAKKAFLMNRVGDAGFLLGIFLVYVSSGTTDLADLALRHDLRQPLATLAGLLLFCGFIGKSAQFPLSTWLPDAMEGPTPVSALIHAATMVAAGIFLLARVHFLLTPDALLVVTGIGLITMLFSAYTALFQTDIKKVLAYSTVSQLGLMVVGMGTGAVQAALFHLTTHAFFKAGLFLAAGSVIHGTGTQDMREMGGLRRLMPVTFIGYLICAAALAGVPLFSGFLSKEALLNGAFDWAERGSGPAMLVPALMIFSSGLTATYMARQARLIFGDQYRSLVQPASAVHESGPLMTGPVVLLAALSLALTFSWNPFSAEHSWFYRLFPVDNAIDNLMSLQIANQHLLLALISIGAVVIGAMTGYFLPKTDPEQAPGELAERWLFRPFQTFARRLHRFDQLTVRRLTERGWHLDRLYTRTVVEPALALAEALYRFDRRVIDGLVHLAGTGNVVLAHVVSWFDRYGVDGLVNGAAALARSAGGLTRRVQSGRAQSYIATAVVGLLLILWLLI